MRVLMVVLGFVAFPFAASLCQESAQLSSRPNRDIRHADDRSSDWRQPRGDGENCEHLVRDADGDAHDRHDGDKDRDRDRDRGKDRDDDQRCVRDTQPTPPPPPPPPPGSSITGKVYDDVTGQPGLSGWVIELSGTATLSVVTDASGNYAFTGLATGTYTVCEVLQAGWTQTFPPAGFTPCPTGNGYSFGLTAGSGASLVNFGDVHP